MRSHSRALFAVAALSAFLLLAPLAQAAPKGVAAFFGSASGSEGTSAGQFGTGSSPNGVAVNTTGAGPADPGDIYVVDQSNHRIQRFDVLGQFVSMWGKDVVSPGGAGEKTLPINERQTIAFAVSPPIGGVTGGTFTLSFDPDGAGAAPVESTGPLAFNAPATGAGSIQGALESLPSIGVGDVSVSGGPAPWNVDFTGALAATDAAQISGNGSGLTVSFPGTTPAVSVSTPTQGGVVATHEICTIAADCKGGVTGSLGGELFTPVGVAVDQSNGNVYVIERHIAPAPGGGSRVQAFDGEGEFLWALGKDAIKANPAVNTDLGNVFEVCTHSPDCKAPAVGSKGGELGAGGSNTGSGGGNGIAVVPTDSGSLLPNAGNVLITDRGNRRVQEFTSSGAFVRAFGWDTITNGSPSDPTSVTGFQICTAPADCKAGSAGANSGQFGSEAPNRVAVDSSGDVYTVENSSNFRLQKFTPAGSDLTPALVNPDVGAGGPALSLSGTGSSDTPMDVAVGPDDHLFLIKGYPAGIGNPTALVTERRVVELDSAGAYVETHGSRWGVNAGVYLALNTDSEEIYVAGQSTAGSGVFVLGASAPPTVSMGISGVSTHTAQLNGLINPGGPDTPIGFTVTYRFEYRKVGAPTWTPLGADKDVGNGFATIPVTATLNDLEADTAYEARLLASKRFSGVASIETTPEVFVTPASQPEIDAAYVSERGATTATLNARINPNGQATAYRFEYGPTAAYGTTVPVPDGSAGASTSSQIFSEALTGLAPETTYHFRVIATNASGTAKSGDFAFTTSPATQALIERGYELVSPPDKLGGSGLSIWYTGVGSHSNAGIGAIEGDRFATLSYYGASLADGGFSYGSDATLAERTPSGWVNKPAFNRPGGVESGEFAKLPLLGAASEDLSLAAWGSVTQMRIFEGQVPNAGGLALREWDSGRWEITAPFAAGQQVEEGNVFDLSTTVAADGGYALLGGPLTGVAGPTDPTADPCTISCGSNVYLDDVTAGLSDTFPGEGIRSLVNVCTGDGAERTEIPSVDGAGKVVAAQCPAAAPGRDSRPVSSGGATLASRGDSPGVISDDGSRVFFTSPGHFSSGFTAACSGTGAADTKCPPQVYVRQRNEDGSATVRWISRSAVGGQDASLMSAVFFEGATPDGDKVFFRTASPLTADDPNGGAQLPGGIKTGTPSPNSVDLYMYDFPDAPGANIGEGTLTRISAGPSGAGDANVATSTQLNISSLRAFGADGSRAYFTTAAPLAGVAAPSSGTITAPGGAPNQDTTRNLYAYDSNLPSAQRWRFVAQLPANTTFGDCATTGSVQQDRALSGGANGTGQNGLVQRSNTGVNCARANPDGSFLTFFTDGRLTADDPDSVSGDVYAYDAITDELTRISAPQGGAGGSYTCITDGVIGGLGAQCNADPGIGGLGTAGLVTLNMVTHPADPTDRTAFFESASRLVPGDQNDVYDVYQWRNGELSLLSTGAAGAEPALYQGNDRTGTNVYISTRDRLTWEDVDSVLDVYTARVNGGFDQPISPPACDVLADGCQGAPSAAPVASGASSAALSGQGNVVEKPKPRRCRKGQVRRRGKCVAKKQKRAKRTANQNRRAGK